MATRVGQEMDEKKMETQIDTQTRWLGFDLCLYYSLQLRKPTVEHRSHHGVHHEGEVASEYRHVQLTFHDPFHFRRIVRRVIADRRSTLVGVVEGQIVLDTPPVRSGYFALMMDSMAGSFPSSSSDLQ